jgi:hypothetical protein
LFGDNSKSTCKYWKFDKKQQIAIIGAIHTSGVAFKGVGKDKHGNFGVGVHMFVLGNWWVEVRGTSMASSELLWLLQLLIGQSQVNKHPNDGH